MGGVADTHRTPIEFHRLTFWENFMKKNEILALGVWILFLLMILTVVAFFSCSGLTGWEVGGIEIDKI